MVTCSSAGASISSEAAPAFKCYADTPLTASPDQAFPHQLTTAAPSSTSVTATSLAALARLPGSAAGVLELVPFLKARNGRRGPTHGLEGSGWMMGFMMEGLYLPARARALSFSVCNQQLQVLLI